MEGTPHYYVKLEHRLSAESYFAAVGRLKRFMASRGYELDEFGDTHEVDRQAVRQDGGSACFEGQVVYPRDDLWTEALKAFLDEEELTVRALRFAD